MQAAKGGGPKADVPKGEGEAKRLARAIAKRERLARRELEKQVCVYPWQSTSGRSFLRL